jgi:phosphatidylglycerophosphate synthase
MFISHAILDCLDGELARQCNKTSDFGAHLDAFADHMFLAIVAAFMLSRFIRYDIQSVIICFFAILFWSIYGLNFNPTTHVIKGDLPKFIITNTVLLSVLLYFFLISFFNIS